MSSAADYLDVSNFEYRLFVVIVFYRQTQCKKTKQIFQIRHCQISELPSTSYNSIKDLIEIHERLNIKFTVISFIESLFLSLMASLMSASLTLSNAKALPLKYWHNWVHKLGEVKHLSSQASNSNELNFKADVSILAWRLSPWLIMTQFDKLVRL